MADSGTIKWFSNAKGFGFIVNENGTQDIFVHYSSIIGNGYRTLSLLIMKLRKVKKDYMLKR